VTDTTPDVTLADTGQTSNILPINILPKSPFNTAFTRVTARD
jgi:hypothetical protein